MGNKFHINKHGVPAPCKAKAGNCPLGGEEQHFSNSQDAQDFANQQNEKQHGLLPSMKTEASRDDMNSRASEIFSEIRDIKFMGVTKGLAKLTKELKTLESQFAKTPVKTIIKNNTVSYDGRGVPTATSNLVVSGDGYEDKHNYFSNKVKKAGMDAHKLAENLSSDNNIFDEWKVKSESKDSFTLTSEDSYGNEQNLRVERVEVEEKIKPKNHTRAFSSDGLPMALSNYATHATEGYAGAEKHFKDIIKDSNFNSEKMAKSLNDDKDVFGDWDVEDENLQRIKLRNTDSFGNVDFVEVSKGV